MLVYFGFTYCPDVCPSSLARFAAAINALEEQGHDLSDLGFLFVSVDPKRDSLEILKEYSEVFHPRLLSATGSEEEIARVAKAWSVAYSLGAPDAEGDYAVDHPSYAFGLDRDHAVRSYLWHFAPQDKLEQQILALLE